MDIQKMLNEYFDWLKTETTTHQINEYYEITTPFLNHQNDNIQIYVKSNPDGTIELTDDGFTVNTLKAAGLNFTKNRKAHLDRILTKFGFSLKNSEIIGITEQKKFPEKKHMMLQAILAIDDMHNLAKGKVTSFFFDDLVEFFDEQDIYYAEDIQFVGKSGFTWTYDFLFQRTKKKPERLCRAINSPSKAAIEKVLFSWVDTNPVRRDDSKLIVIVNDTDKFSKNALTAFGNYNTDVILWSERNSQKSIDLLSA
ncbi:DUF1829 domain-containing protein [Acetobacterium malicum]|uniref:DUF1829 domain-containing protein n=1 Tax=Acetobacterium malicum TaxID=52692 RepID=A0ABR6Z1S7_9FIRM|nr:DUF1829 domain-containing protein [Acetobacterium malicum]MBC3901378.1 DUF1829 domain-containing protein [Acetobacterium malicum]